MIEKLFFKRIVSRLLICVSVVSLASGFALTASAQNSGSQQQDNVTGRVLDINGEPVVGAVVSVSGTKTVTVTDFDGNFQISASKGNTLEVTCLGLKNVSVSVGNNPHIITMEEDEMYLNEVVVVGYGTARKKDVTGAVASVQSRDLNTVASSSVSQMLQGKVSGVSAIQSSAQPGAGISVNIRGAVSPSGSNSPLYVIDGVPLQTNSTADPGLTTSYDLKTGVNRDPLNTINPNDIERIDVLKDASAAAIYGAAAANGVVLITTKSGKSGKPKVEWRSVVTSQIQKAYPEVMDAKTFREQANFWTKEYYLYSNKMGVYGDNAIDLASYSAPFANVSNYTADTDWMKEVSRNGYIVDQNLSVNGGNDKSKYFMSYNYYDNQGMLKQSGMVRHSVRLNIDQKFSERVKGELKMNYSNVRNNSTSTGASGKGDNMLLNALRFAPDQPVKEEDGTYSKSYDVKINNPVSFTDIKDNTTTERVFIAPSLEVNVLDGLNIKATGGYDRQNSVRKFYYPLSAEGTATQVANGMADLGQATVSNISGEIFANYDKIFNDIHHITALLGAGYYYTDNTGFGLAAYNFFTDGFGYDNVGIASDKDLEKVRSWRSDRTKLSQFARLNYSLKDCYMLTLTVRHDGSSYFAKNNKWGWFPSASIAWRISEENFMKGKTPFSELKLRAGYGAVGNENVVGSNSLAMYTYRSDYGHIFGKTTHTGLVMSQVDNPDLKWETDYTLNLGLDWGLFNQRLTGTIELFHRGAKDLIDYKSLPTNGPVGRVAANVGETESKGFEFSLNSYNITGDKFTWTTNFTASYFTANWVKRNPAVTLADYIGETDDIYAIYGWKTDGIIKSKSDIPSYMPNAQVGNIKYMDVNNDGVLDSKDVVNLGTSAPKWYVGLGNTFTYKGFDLNIYFYGSFGNLKTRGQIPDTDIIGNHGIAPGNTYVNVATDVWNSQNGQGWMPGVASNSYDEQNPTGVNDFHLMSGSYVKLKNITLGYSLSDKLFLNSKFVRGVRFFLDAQNVATFTSYEGFDPELETGNPYPQALSLSIGLNMNF